MNAAYRSMHTIFDQVNHASFDVQYWDYKKVHYGKGNATFTIIFRKPEAIENLFRDISLGFGEGYMHGDIEVEGDLLGLTTLIYDSNIAQIKPSLRTVWEIFVMRLRAKNRLGKAKENVSFHYDLGNEFYNLWLDKRMVYSCAYYKDPNNSLDQAQEDKLEYICRKLLLKPGQTLLDIGSGWGALVIYAVKKYGVKAHGITLSKSQLEKSKALIAKEGLESEITLELIDYRELAERDLTFDRVVSIGMLEHVGKDNLDTYMKATNKLLKPNGVGLIHTIGFLEGGFSNNWISKYIFPGTYLPSPGELANGLKNVHLEVYHLENLQQHYALTLRAWLTNYDAHMEELKNIVSPETLRAFRLYLAGVATAFSHGGMSLYQVSFCKNHRLSEASIPLTNAHLHV